MKLLPHLIYTERTELWLKSSQATLDVSVLGYQSENMRGSAGIYWGNHCWLMWGAGAAGALRLLSHLVFQWGK